MERQQRTLTLLLIIALIFGGYNSLQLRNLRQELKDSTNRNSQQISSTESSLRSAIWSINNSLAQVREDERWVYPASYAANEAASTAEKVAMEISWSFRELQRGAQVYLLYRPDTQHTSTEWTRVNATAQEGAAYTATVALSPLMEYEYHIVVEGDYFRSTKPVNIPGTLYQLTPLRISSWGGNHSRDGKWIGNFQIEVEQYRVSLFEFQNPKDVFLTISREDGTTARVDASQINRDGYRAWLFNFPAENLVSAKLGVEYGDGNVYYSDIWSESDDWRHQHTLEFQFQPSGPK